MCEIDSELQKNFLLAEKFFSEKKYLETVKLYKEILIEHPKLLGAINNLGLAYEHLNQLDDSIEYYKKCSLIAPKEKIFINNVANIYYKKNDYINSVKEITRSLLIDDNQIKIIETKANCLINLDLKKEADIFFNQYLRIFPNNVLLNTLCGKNLISLNLHKRGLEYLKKGTGFIEFTGNNVNII